MSIKSTQVVGIDLGGGENNRVNSPCNFASLPITLIPGARPLGIFETRLVALEVIAPFRPILRKKLVEKEDCEECKGGASTSFFRNPGNTCILSSPLLSI